MKLPILFIIISSFSSFLFKSNIIQPVQCTSPSLFDPFNLDLTKQSSNNIDPNVKKVCESTDNPELCFSALSYMQKGNNDKGKTDVTTLLEMQIKAVQEAIQLALTLEPNNAKSSNSGRSMQALKDCKEVYTDALDNMKQALDAISRADKGTVNSMLSAAISDFGTCDDGFIENDDTSPMAEYGAKLSKLVSNCLATASSL